MNLLKWVFVNLKIVICEISWILKKNLITKWGFVKYASKKYSIKFEI